MPSLSVARFHGHDLGIKLLGFLHPPRFVEAERRSQFVR
jgi:hypothetical protein